MICGNPIKAMEMTMAGIVNNKMSPMKSPPKYSKELRPDMCIICRRPFFFSDIGMNAYIPAVNMLPRIRKKVK